MTALIKSFKTRYVFYVELVSNDILLGTGQLTSKFDVADFSANDDVHVALDDFDGFDCVGADDLPGYVAVTFFRVVNGRKIWLRSYLYGPGGYIGDFSLPAGALQAARVQRDKHNRMYGM
ncbi:hypothetical protein [Agrobacterium tumefaciens]|uniref:hypothetical protein n=1 Tax=Agrobacterium tumefaciens TaxID=358 RepID=UPI00287DAC7A|nr:hypothetical protein [Agrobacterium tumefaciens]MDS7595488.1 hypothetical protein [Agrobacterium tumefaciens]